MALMYLENILTFNWNASCSHLPISRLRCAADVSNFKLGLLISRMPVRGPHEGSSNACQVYAVIVAVLLIFFFFFGTNCAIDIQKRSNDITAHDPWHHFLWSRFVAWLELGFHWRMELSVGSPGLRILWEESEAIVIPQLTSLIYHHHFTMAREDDFVRHS